MRHPILLDSPNGIPEERRWLDAKGYSHRWGGPAKEFSNGTKHWYWHGCFVWTDFGGRPLTRAHGGYSWTENPVPLLT